MSEREYCDECGNYLVSGKAHYCGGFSSCDRDTDQIAALTERLRIVEAERDEAHATIRARSAAHSQVADENGRMGAELSALRAELERKDAALTMAREERVEAAKRLSRQAARWVDDFIADSELIDAINGELDAALQPKEPPCKA